jgi:hypothetical protein
MSFTDMEAILNVQKLRGYYTHVPFLRNKIEDDLYPINRHLGKLQQVDCGEYLAYLIIELKLK